MTLSQLTATLRSFFQRGDTFAAALAPTPFYDDDPRAVDEPDESVDAEFWLNFCRDRFDAPLMMDRQARKILENAALWHSTTGLNNKFFLFDDGSKLLISDVMECVL